MIARPQQPPKLAAGSAQRALGTVADAYEGDPHRGLADLRDRVGDLAGFSRVLSGADDLGRPGREQLVKSGIGGDLTARRDGDGDKVSQLKLARARGAQITPCRAEIGAA